LTATWRPSCSRPRYTTAIDARPIGTGSELGEHLVQRRTQIVLDDLAHLVEQHDGAGVQTRAEFLGHRIGEQAGDEATSWPSFMNVPPRSSHMRR